MYNNQYQMDTYPQGQLKQMNMYNPSQEGYYTPQEGAVSPQGNYPITTAPPAFNASAHNATQHQGQAYHSGNQPIMNPPPPYSPPTPTNIVNNQTTVVTQAFGTVKPVVAIGGPPPNHFIFALLTCLFCFWPISIFALIKSSEVNSAYAAGDIHRAQRASTDARKYSMISLVVGIFYEVGLVVFLVVWSVAVRAASNVNSTY